MFIIVAAKVWIATIPVQQNGNKTLHDMSYRM